MKAWSLLAVFTMGGVVMAACGDDDSNNTGAGGGDTTTATTTTTGVTVSTTASVTSSSTGGGTPTGVCDSGLFFDTSSEPGVVDGCLDANCCDSFDPCVADATCLACLSNPGGAGCDTNPLYAAFTTCFDNSCPTSICDTTLGYSSPNLNLCVNNSCCATFTLCEADPDCNACLLNPMLVACETNTLFTDFTDCRDTACAPNICGAPIVYVITYDNMATDYNFASNACATDNCCTHMDACADPSDDGYLEMNDPESQACLACLNNDPACPGGAVEQAANDYSDCFDMNCK